MILAAALLVLAAVGLFVRGLATGARPLYWACAAVSAVAVVLLVVAWLRMRRAADEAAVLPADAAVQPRTAVAGSDAGSDAGERSAGAHAASAHRGEDRHTAGTEYRSTPEGSHSQVSGEPAPEGVATDATGGTFPPPSGADRSVPLGGDEPPVEEVEVNDLLLIVDLRNDVVVVDEHPRYHVPDCSWLVGRTSVPLPLDEARGDGFTPCGRCTPDRRLAEAERARRAARRAP